MNKQKILKKINELQQFLESDLYTRFRPADLVLGEGWAREKQDVFKNEKEFIEYLEGHFDILKKGIEELE